MPDVSVTVVLHLEVAGEIDPVAMERAIMEEGRRAARALYVETAAAIEAELLLGAGARQRLEHRWVATTAGRVRLGRWRVRSSDGSTACILDDVLGLGRAEATPALREAACDVATRVPFREAAVLLERITGASIGAQSMWRLVQDEGARIRAGERWDERALIEDGVLPSGTPERAAPLVVVQADGTYLRAQREGQSSFEVRTAVCFTGKDAAGGRNHRRRALRDKHCYATTAGAEGFGRAVAVAGVQRYRMQASPHVLACHDGLDDLGQVFRGWFPRAIRQADHWHVAQWCWRAVDGDRARFDRLRRAAFADPRVTARRLRAGRYAIAADVATDLARYLDRVADELWGIRKIPAALRSGAMFIVSTQAVEKHQDLLVGRRMKRRGMRWTRQGADHLLALRALRFSGRWPTRWGVVAA